MRRVKMSLTEIDDDGNAVPVSERRRQAYVETVERMAAASGPAEALKIALAVMRKKVEAEIAFVEAVIDSFTADPSKGKIVAQGGETLHVTVDLSGPLRDALNDPDPMLGATEAADAVLKALGTPETQRELAWLALRREGATARMHELAGERWAAQEADLEESPEQEPDPFEEEIAAFRADIERSEADLDGEFPVDEDPQKRQKRIERKVEEYAAKRQLEREITAETNNVRNQRTRFRKRWPDVKARLEMKWEMADEVEMSDEEWLERYQSVSDDRGFYSEESA